MGKTAERKLFEPEIKSVEFYYMGTDNQFNDFLKAVVRDYIVDDKCFPNRLPRMRTEKRCRSWYSC